MILLLLAVATRLSIIRVFWPNRELSTVDWTHFLLKRFLLKVSSICANWTEEVSRAFLTLAFSLLLREVNTETAFARFKVGSVELLTGPAIRNKFSWKRELLYTGPAIENDFCWKRIPHWDIPLSTHLLTALRLRCKHMEGRHTFTIFWKLQKKDVKVDKRHICCYSTRCQVDVVLGWLLSSPISYIQYMYKIIYNI